MDRGGGRLSPAPGEPPPGPSPAPVPIGPGAVLLPGAARGEARHLLAAIARIAREAPFRRWRTRRGEMSVAMTGCGERVWVSDRGGGGYASVDPASGTPWPAMPPAWPALAAGLARAAGYAGFAPDCCLVNRYRPGTALGLHADRDERCPAAPIVSVSLGGAAVFLWEPEPGRAPDRIRLGCGDAVVFGGASRFARHGIALLRRDAPTRYNLTFRTTGLAPPPGARSPRTPPCALPTPLPVPTASPTSTR